MAETEERLDVEAAIEHLNEALELQYRAPLAHALAAGSVVGFEYLGLASELWDFAAEELADVRRLVEKIVALGGEPATNTAELSYSKTSQKAVEWLIDIENETIDSLQAAIEPTGREGRSEALEHLLEHIILRKQNQVDFLVRASRG
jgi:bacterioferritin (cytochrome b1)